MGRTTFGRAAFAFSAATAMALTWLATGPSRAAEEPFIIPPPKTDIPPSSGLKTAVIPGGCFWGVQGVYQHTNGVVQAVSGYAGGKESTANYDTVSTGTTGHAESVKITYDPQKISYGKILQIYFSVVHDPTQLNRQGPDSGPSYRSEIFFNTPMQQKIAEAYVKQLSDAHIFQRPIVTKIEANKGFYPAESYHQDFMLKNPQQGYIVRWDAPMVAAMKKMFPGLYRDAFRAG